MKRLLYRWFRAASSFQHRLDRRFTRAGWLALGVVVAAAVIGLDTNRTVGHPRWTGLVARTRGAEVTPTPLPPIAATGETEVSVELTPLRRGHVRFEGLTIARPDPLGLVQALMTIPLPQSLLVLPKRYPVRPIRLLGQRKYQPGGVALASSIGESDEFISLRDYRPGDPLRRIHWR